MSSLDRWDFEGIPVVKETHLTRKPAPRSFAVALASVTAMFLVSLLYWSDAFGIAGLLPASREAVFERGDYWRLLTSLFAHADFRHFLSNGIVFGVLAFLLFGYYGALAYPGLSVPLGALVTALSLRSYPPDTLLVGASGAVYWMAGFWLTLYLLVERRTRLRSRFVRAVGFGLIVLVPTAIEPHVSYRTHAIGFGLGVAAGLLYFSKRKEALRASERIEFD
jgi:rhomboid protease GluP